MRDVAERAGVSIATVSFVVNNTKPVTDSTRKRIEEAMAELGFRRNSVARALASRQTRILALVYPALEHHLSTSGIEFITSAAREARSNDYHLVVWPVSNDAAELADLVGQGLVDGVLLMEVQLADPRVGVLQSLDSPFVLIGRTAEPSGLDYVDIDFDESIRRCVDHLWDVGHRNIALISGDQRVPSFERYGPYVRMEDAFRRIAAERHFEPVVLNTRSGAKYGREIALELSRTHPQASGVVIFGEPTVTGLLAGLRAAGRRVPDDVSVVAALAAADIAYTTDPPLTTLTSPGVELGQLAVRALLRRLSGGEPLPPELRCGEFLPGESTAAPPHVAPSA
ncbi:LacI family DNA-binding transcriptional regulator [Microlunatus elymi]|nr:LacI family DNA-binding transcriptional regulator [Microlunatus elymi]